MYTLAPSCGGRFSLRSTVGPWAHPMNRGPTPTENDEKRPVWPPKWPKRLCRTTHICSAARWGAAGRFSPRPCRRALDPPNEPWTHPTNRGLTSSGNGQKRSVRPFRPGRKTVSGRSSIQVWGWSLTPSPLSCQCTCQRRLRKNSRGPKSYLRKVKINNLIFAEDERL